MPTKTGLVAVLFAVLACAQAPSVLAQSESVPFAAVMSQTQGQVRIVKGADAGAGDPAREKNPLQAGSTIVTGPGAQLVLAHPDGQVTIIGENSVFRIVAYSYNAKDPASASVSFNLVEGSVRFIMGDIGRENPGAVRLQAGVATLGLLPSPGSPTDATVLVQGGPMAVTVQSGQLQVASPSGPMQQVGAGQGLILTADGAVRRGSVVQVAQQLASLPMGPQLTKQLGVLQSQDGSALKSIASGTLLAAVAANLVLDPPPTATTTPPPAVPLLGATSTPSPGSAGGAGGAGCSTASCN